MGSGEAEQVDGLDRLLGFDFTEVSGDRVVVSWTVGPQHLQPFGIVHGGTYCAAHETAASIAGQAWLRDGGLVVGVNNSTDFLRQAREGAQMTSAATPVHRGRTQQLWLVETSDADGRLVARGQVRLVRIDGTMPPDMLARLTGGVG